MKIMKNNDNLDDWQQLFVIHCPDKNCKGMLLTNPMYHELKCSDCGKYFIEQSNWIEVKIRAKGSVKSK